MTAQSCATKLPLVHRDHHPKGVLLIILGQFTFVTVNVTLRFLDHPHSSVEILFFRYLFGMLPAFALLHWIYGWRSLETTQIQSHALRGVIGAFSIGCLFQSILLLPFADATVLTFCSSIFVVALAAFFLKEKTNWQSWGCVLLGLLGILIIAKPTGDGVMLGIFLGLTSAFIEGAIMVHNRFFTRQESGGAILFYQTLFSLLACGILLPWVWVLPSLHDSLIFMTLGLGGGLGQYLIIKAYRFAPARLLAPMIYMSMLWSLVYGYFFFGESPTFLLFLGSGLIILSGMLVIRVEKRYSTTNELTNDSKM